MAATQQTTRSTNDETLQRKTRSRPPHLEAQGFRWAAAVCRGDNIGRVVSKHRTYEAANRAARNRDLDIVDLMQPAI
jgi:hypothetical protein